MRVQTRVLGCVDVAPERVYRFAAGLFGYPHLKRFALIGLPRSQGKLQWLQSVDDVRIGFLVMEPRLYFPSYCPLPLGTDLADLQLKGPGRVRILVMAVVPGDCAHATVNLKAPLLLNPDRSLGKQLLLEGTDYPVRCPVFPVGLPLAEDAALLAQEDVRVWVEEPRPAVHDGPEEDRS